MRLLKWSIFIYLVYYIMNFDTTTDIPIRYVSEEKVKRRLDKDMINLKHYDLILKDFFIKEHNEQVLEYAINKIESNNLIVTDVLAVWYLESHFKTQIVNYQQGDNKSPIVRCNYRATGLFQLMPSTATDLGINNYIFYHYNIYQQIDLYFKYTKPYLRYMKNNNLEELYLINFLPIALVKGYETFPKRFTKGNEGLDIDKNGYITRKEFRVYIIKSLKKLI